RARPRPAALVRVLCGRALPAGRRPCPGTADPTGARRHRPAHPHHRRDIDVTEPAGTAPLDPIEGYRRMRLVRRVEESLMELKTAGEVPGSIHLCNGQEAIPVGSCAALDERDRVVATYRGHGWALALGTDPSALFAEVMGRDSALNGGRAASPYLSDPSVGFLGENSIVG